MDLGQIQAYAYFFFTGFLVFVLYGYIIHLYKAQKDGTRDYEKYGNLALDDEVSSEPLETIERSEKTSQK